MRWKTADLTEQSLLAPAVTTRPPTYTLLLCCFYLLVQYFMPDLLFGHTELSCLQLAQHNTTHSNTDKLSPWLVQSSAGVGQQWRSQLYCVGS